MLFHPQGVGKMRRRHCMLRSLSQQWRAGATAAVVMLAGLLSACGSTPHTIKGSVTVRRSWLSAVYGPIDPNAKCTSGSSGYEDIHSGA